MPGRTFPRWPLLAGAMVLLCFAATASAAPAASDALWRGIESTRAAGAKTSTATYRLNKDALESVLRLAPKEGQAPLGRSEAILTLPMPDGSLARFRIEESSVFEPALAAEHPEIRSYRAQAVDLPGATMRFDWTPQGFHALMLGAGTSVTVHPKSSDPDAEYLASSVTDAKQSFACGVVDETRFTLPPGEQISAATGDQLRTYRVAISTTGEFTQDLGGGTVAGALAALNTILNGLNAVYERELAVHINLIAGLNAVIFTNAATDPYTNGDTNAMITQVVATLGANIPTGNYDFGHVIGTNSGGLAGVGVICNNTISDGGPRKAAAASGAALPVGGAGNVSLIGHEMGHQFGANHTQNSPCNRSPLNAYEPGSGQTIMSYNGVCPPNNTVGIGELRFNSSSLAAMNAYIATQACQVSTVTGNAVPTVNGGPDRTIPVNTPFTLTAVGNDANPADVPNLTYAWEQADPGQLTAVSADFPNPPFQDQPGDPSTTTRPIFTALATSSSPSRTFPRMGYVLANANDPPDQVSGLFTAEELPRVGRTLNFRVTVRDNRAGAGGTNDDLVTLTVSGASGPFLVSAPNGGETWTVGSTQNVTWSVNNTNNAPVSCANVKISLSLDGGSSFPIVLAASTPNDGAQTVTVPGSLNTASARVKVEAVGNVFFDVSNANFSINAGAGCPFVSTVLPSAGNAGTLVTLGGSGFTGVTAVRFSNSVTSVFTVVNDGTITATVPVGAVTGAITLSKAACPDVPTASFTVCPNNALTAQIEDGSGEQFWSGSSFVNRLTPSAYPATLSQVLIQQNSTFGVPAGSPITVLFGANPGGTADLSTVVLQTMPGTSNPDNVFKTFDVPQLTINSGDFVVGYAVTGGTFPGFSDNSGAANRSYGSSNGVFGSSTLPDNLLIRARYFTACGTPSVCPSVTNLAPTSGLVGSNVVITGTNFTGVDAVRFTNNVSAAFTVDNGGQITATVPAGATTGPITLTKPGCTAVQTATFTVTAPSCPTVSNLAPTTGLVGSNVVITGTNFTGTTSVTFTNNVTAAFTVDNATQITATVPAGAVNGPITVTKTGCTPVQTASFTIGGPGTVHACATPGAAIPDNTPGGITSTITIPENLTITSLTVGVNITHTWSGDLIVELRRGATTVRLHNLTGGSADDIVGTYPTTLTVSGPGALTDLNGQNTSGTWTLFVSDNAGDDTGTLNQWCLDIQGTPPCPAVTNLNPTTGPVGSNVVITGTNFTGVDGVKFTNNVTATFTVDNATQITAAVPAGAVTGPITITKAGCAAVQTATFTVGTNSAHACVNPGTAIPDNAAAGITSTITIPENLTITSLTVGLNLTHTFIGDLIVELRRGATTVRLHNLSGGSADNIVGTYPTTLAVSGPGALADFNGQNSAGTWTLFVSDNAADDFGTLNQWCLDIQGTPVSTGVEPGSGALAFRIAPNPVVHGSSISFMLPKSGVTSVRILDLAGRVVARLRDGWSTAGPQQFQWDGRDRNGTRVQSGIYFVAVDGVGVRARGKLSVSR